MAGLPLLPRCALFFCLASSAAAGSVWRVGATQTFATLQAAVDAAASGDLVLVDPGTYPAFAITGKGIAVVAANGSFSLLTAPGVPALLVRDVPADRTVSVLGAEILYAEPDAPAVRVLANAGAVRLSRLVVTLAGDLGPAAARAAVEVQDTSTFWLIDSRVWSDVPRSAHTTLPTGANDGVSAVELWNSDGVLQNVALRGYDNPGSYAGDGLRIRDRSWVWLRDDMFASPAGSRYQGGKGGAFGGHALHQIKDAPQQDLITMCPAVGLTLGTGTTRAGGYYGINNNPGVHVMGAVTTWRLPDVCSGPQLAENSVLADTVPIGGAITVRVWSVANRSYATVLTGRTRFGRNLPGFFGHPMVDLAAPISQVISIGTTRSGVAQVFTVPVPANLALAGLQLSIQTAFGPSTGLNALSGPALVVVTP